MHRRRFFRHLAGSAAALSATGVASAREAIDRSGPPNIQLGLAAYSFRRSFGFMKGKTQEPKDGGRPLDIFGFVDYCAEQEIAGAELTSYFFPPDAGADYFRRLRRHAHLRGVTICGTAIGNNFSKGPGEEMDREIAAAKAWIEKAALFGAPHIRFFAGTARDLARDPKNLDHAITALEECAEAAARHGIMIGVENHGQLTSDQVLAIMKGVKSKWIGVNLDTGNFISNDPYGDIAKCVPYAVNVQLKVNIRNPKKEKVHADLPRIGQILRDGNYQGFVVLEYEEEDPRANIPRVLGEMREAFAR